MLLSVTEIQHYINSGEIILSPFEEKNFKEGSYSFTVRSRVARVKPASEYNLGQPAEYEQIDIPEQGYILEPGAFAIFYTLETIALGNNVLCLLSTRGSVAKLGIDVLQSSLVVEPGSNSVLALETYNHGPCPIRMIPGISVIKGIFFRV